VKVLPAGLYNSSLLYIANFLACKVAVPGQGRIVFLAQMLAGRIFTELVQELHKFAI
jgi:hypothetical protein